MAGEIIRMDDPTSHGGTVIEGCLTATYMGKPIALIGHQTSCPKCGGTYPIIEGVSTTTFFGKSVAVAGMKTACGAVLIASQFTGTVEQTRGAAEAASRTDATSANTAQHRGSAMLAGSRGDPGAGAQADAVEIEEFYSLTSGNGQPLENYSYDLFVDDELHTRAARYAAGRTASIRGGVSTHLITWLDRDSAAK
jgi:uncharacterized Zn-binding protein involved in type VI secretion